MTRCAVLCCAVLCCAVLCCAVLCCAVLCCAVLCYAVLCCAVPPCRWGTGRCLLGASCFAVFTRLHKARGSSQQPEQAVLLSLLSSWQWWSVSKQFRAISMVALASHARAVTSHSASLKMAPNCFEHGCYCPKARLLLPSIGVQPLAAVWPSTAGPCVGPSTELSCHPVM